ncbi:MAG: ATP-dependent Clp protease adaptor ClpS [Bacteroidetes bacterium]|nr:ATP-dependent Clp protease adaptor ClpS [Bacteroidota bacterium]MBU1580501.1 ATP-dependent Clp protease adaptor ClpS [Bacteroidota bacterium]MBU2465471.1 ATP-dependent Clp protease adaptor ClpS [Bacteroidota bacterium]MBU2556446.1 ATP-dependent Clp protease adaptor ClpS [Bacteroidota bacterium]
MSKEKEALLPSSETKAEKEKNLILFNDDINSFDFVIQTLMEICDHSPEQAETCAWVTHFKGKCPIKSGSYDQLNPYKLALLERKLTVSIQ